MKRILYIGFLLLFAAILLAGCDAIDTVKSVAKRVGISFELESGHLDAAATAINAEIQAKNAATSAVAQKTLTAATEVAPEYVTKAAKACKKVVENINEDGDYSDLIPGSTLPGCDFNKMDFFGLNLSKTDLRSANFDGADLTNVDLSRADLKFAVFTKAKLISTSFVQADLTGANFKGADMTGADMRGANLTDAIITRPQLETVADLTGTILPETIPDR